MAQLSYAQAACAALAEAMRALLDRGERERRSPRALAAVAG